ncbi:MAG: hypothetical protein LBU04_00220 [Christensenellaceae bacterium]|jgi:hypothetical protein|nr:hypothetical protein [Christensenellaceae bacterium]
MIRLIDFFRPLENFQYSVNLEYDLNDDNKIKAFIPTNSALEILEDILNSTKTHSSDRARILTGAYGKGKSHLTLTLLAMLAGKPKKLFSNIVDRAKKVSPRISNNIEQFFERETQFIPVLLSNQSTDLKTTLLIGLNKALHRAGLTHLMPTTFFDAAIAKLESWKIDFPETYSLFSRKINGSVENFKSKLEHYDSAEYDYFVRIYPTLTSGSEFNPMLGADVENIIDSVLDAIILKGFSGLFIVYDEFSKFLDGNKETGSARNVKLLQDLAEKCNRSQDKQIHILLISHKNIENYVSDLPKKVVDDWRGISKRFKPLAVESSYRELFEIITIVLNKDENTYSKYLQEKLEEFNQLKRLIMSQSLKVAHRRSAFSDVIEHTGFDFVERCYPLHPYSIIILPKISELVAQNERTIFTFLASNEKHAVNYYIKKNEDPFPLIEPDKIYDFFETQFKNEPFGSAIRHQWQIAAAALNIVAGEDNRLSIKIIKAITLIYIINQFDVLPPSLDLIRDIYGKSELDREVEVAISIIDQCGLLIKLEFKPYVRIREVGGNNADALIEEGIIRYQDTNIRAALKNSLPSNYLYPVAYNDEFEMTRYFQIEFVDLVVLKQIHDPTDFVLNADGCVLAVVVNNDEERLECIDLISKLTSNLIVFAVPKSTTDISKSIVKYTAILDILKKDDEKKNDKSNKLTVSAIDELMYIGSDLADLIENYIDTQFFSPEHKKTEYYFNGSKREVNRRTGLLSLLSDICREVYSRTPVIVNENINREFLSAQMKKARHNILKSALAPIIEENFGLTNTQDINVARSVYFVPNIVTDMTNPKILLDEKLDEKFSYMFKIICDFIKRAINEEISFLELYDTLRNPSFGISLRKGVIPFYIVAALKQYKSIAIIKKRHRELQLTATILEDINDDPAMFTIKIERLDARRITYIAGIEKEIHQFVASDEREFSSFNYITVALQKWFFHLSRFDRESMRICDGEKYKNITNTFESRFKTILASPELNAHEFLFVKLPSIARTNDLVEVVKLFSSAVREIENNRKNVIKKTISELLMLFKGKENQSLSSVLQDYYESLNERTKHQVFDGTLGKFLEVIRLRNLDDKKITETLIKNLFGLRLEDFNDVYADQIPSRIINVKNQIDKFNKENKDVIIDSNNWYEICFFNSDGTSEKKHITPAKEIPPAARTFANEIDDVIESYGEAMTNSEKAQVILESIRRLIK